MESTLLVWFCDENIDTAKSTVAENWILNIQSVYNGQILIVGLNCKWRSHPIKSLSSKIVTLQLCVDTKCLILQLTYMDYIPNLIKKFLSDSNVVFVGIEAEEISLKLKNEYGFYINKIIYVRTLVKLHFPLSLCGKPGLTSLAYRLVQLRMWKPKDVCLLISKLQSKVLSVEQVKFACVDAYVSYRIGQKLLKETP